MIKKIRLKVIKFNVGGKKYVTTLSTLKSKGENFLTLIAENESSGILTIIKDEEGFIFIDRNGRAFEPILDYLRTGELDTSTVPKSVLFRELDFYGIILNE